MRVYRDHLSDFHDWKDKDYADRWLVFPENIGDDLSIDEVDVSGGELYTVLTNKERHGKTGCLVAIVQGTKAETVIAAIGKIPLAKRKTVQNVTRDLDDSMVQIATVCFPNARQIDDRFHVQQLVSDALQEIRVALRKEAIKENNAKVREAREKRKEQPSFFVNSRSSTMPTSSPCTSVASTSMRRIPRTASGDCNDGINPSKSDWRSFRILKHRCRPSNSMRRRS